MTKELIKTHEIIIEALDFLRKDVVEKLYRNIEKGEEDFCLAEKFQYLEVMIKIEREKLNENI